MYSVKGRRLNLHAPRVSFITHLALTGTPPAVAQKLARHSDVRLTMAVYTQFGADVAGAAVERLPALP